MVIIKVRSLGKKIRKCRSSGGGRGWGSAAVVRGTHGKATGAKNGAWRRILSECENRGSEIRKPEWLWIRGSSQVPPLFHKAIMPLWRHTLALLRGGASKEPRDWTWDSCIAGRFFTVWATRVAQRTDKTSSNTYMCCWPHVPYWMEKAMAPHSSTLAWKIPWTEEPRRLQSMGLLRVGHDWATSLSLFSFMHWRRKWQPTPVFLPGESQGRGSLVGCCLWGRTESDTTEVT